MVCYSCHPSFFYQSLCMITIVSSPSLQFFISTFVLWKLTFIAAEEIKIHIWAADLLIWWDIAFSVFQIRHCMRRNIDTAASWPWNSDRCLSHDIHDKDAQRALSALRAWKQMPNSHQLSSSDFYIDDIRLNIGMWIWCEVVLQFLQMFIWITLPAVAVHKHRNDIKWLSDWTRSLTFTPICN